MEEFLFGTLGEVIGGAIVDFVCESLFSELFDALPLRLRYGASWRARARQEIVQRRIASGRWLR